MATTIKRLTYDDLETIPQEREGDRHEIIDGELVVTPSPSPKHQIASRNLFRRLDQHVVANDLGEVYYAPLDIRFTPDNVLIPDIIFIARDRLHVIGSRAPVARRMASIEDRFICSACCITGLWPPARSCLELAPRSRLCR